MSEERKNMEVGIGEKGEAPAGTEIIKTVKPEEVKEDEVGGRYRRIAYVNCPYCYSNCRIVEETEYQMWFVCWNCRGSFRY